MQLNVESIPNGARICSAHFMENDFKIVHGRRMLAPNALPHIERAIEDIQNDIIMPSTSALDTSKVDRATSPIPGCSGFVDQSTSMSPKKEENFLEKEYLRKQLQDTKKFYKRKIKDLQQSLRRKQSICSLKGILDSLREKNMLATEEVQMLKDIGGPNCKIVERQLRKNRDIKVKKTV